VAIANALQNTVQYIINKSCNSFQCSCMISLQIAAISGNCNWQVIYSILRSPSSIQHPMQSIKYTASYAVHQIYSILYSPSNIQHPTQSIKYTASYAVHKIYSILSSPSNINYTSSSFTGITTHCGF
jgi:hypothetical protein